MFNRGGIPDLIPVLCEVFDGSGITDLFPGPCGGILDLVPD